MNAQKLTAPVKVAETAPTNAPVFGRKLLRVRTQVKAGAKHSA